MANEGVKVASARSRYSIRSEDGLVHAPIPDLLDVATKRSVALCRTLCSPKRIDDEVTCTACIAARKT
jgi:hypothetical protein